MKIYLREVTLEDGIKIVKWRNAPNVSKHCLNKRPITLESNEKFFNENIKTGNYKQYIVERVDEQYEAISYSIATVYLKDMDMANKRCELCIFTSNDEEWNTESQSMAIRMLLKKAFTEYKMHKVYSYVFVEFLDEAELLKNAGFRVEAILNNEAQKLDGTYSDVIRYSILDKDFKND